MKYRSLLFLAVSLSACATGPAPMASHGTQERWQRIMEQMRADSTNAAAHATPLEKSSVAASPIDDATIPTGIDVSKFELPVQYNERVQHYLDLYSQRRRHVFAGWLRRMGRYRSYVEERIAAHGLPKELVYLPLIESGYETSATSRAAAVGLWQFMAVTARSEGLEVSEYVDERRDPYRSTDAALRHLSGLHKTFGSWYLAAAAYNSGSGRIGRLLKEFGRKKGPDETFWEIQDALPAETRGYVPGLVAAAIIGEYPHLFGMENERFEPAERFETVIVPGRTDLRAVARAAETSVDVIKGLNPHYIKGMTPPDRESDVRIPVGARAGFAAAFAKIPKAERVRDFARTHVVKQGETLSEIANRYGTTVDALQKANRIKRPDAVAAGRKLAIPGDSPRASYGTD